MKAFMRWCAQDVVQTVLLIAWCAFFLGVAAATHDWTLGAVFALLLAVFGVMLAHELRVAADRQRKQVRLRIGIDATAFLAAIQEAQATVDLLAGKAGQR